MLKSHMLKYVAGPQTFAYMPPILALASCSVGFMLYFLGQIAGFSVIPGLVVGLVACGASAAAGFRDPHISNILLCRQKFLKRTPGLVPMKGKNYVG